jgi:transcription initiation factor TFIID subunit 11
MASPPNPGSPLALSPPGPSPAQLPNKKRSSTLDVNPPNKRRKASNNSATPAHPLRQTSFPPEAGSPFPRSPSVDATSHVSGSAVSGLTADGKTKKKRGRKPKGSKGRDGDDTERTSSLAGSKAQTQVSGQGGSGDKDGEEDSDEEMAVENAEARTQEQEQEEHRMRAMLYQALDNKQRNQYEVWRGSSVKDSNVKRVSFPSPKNILLQSTCLRDLFFKVVNATVSQSVPAMVSTAVRAVTKVFAGELIEMARQVQDEYVLAGEIQAELPTPPASSTGEAEAEANADAFRDDHRRGPLRPEHLREAWRRYKLSGESNGVGTQQLWHAQQGDGVERFSTRTGKRLFK